MVLLKWAGSKASSKDFIIEKIGNVEGNYYEPFLGGGSVAFGLILGNRIRGSCFLSDVDADLMNFWGVVRNNSEKLKQHITAMITSGYYSKATYYEIRKIFNEGPKEELTDIQSIARAGMIYFLNRQGFNGLWRRNSRGEYNVPVGDNRGVDIEKMKTDVAWHSKILGRTSLMVSDFRPAIRGAKKGDAIYMDPPYYSESGKNFTQYNGQIFTHDDMNELLEIGESLSDKGVRVFISSPGYYLPKKTQSRRIKESHELAVRRAINSDSSNRGSVKEKLLELM